MALHSKEAVRDLLDDDVYASNDVSVAMPKYRFPKEERNPRHAHAVVRDELLLDGNSRQNLATFCQTWLEPEVHALMNEREHHRRRAHARRHLHRPVRAGRRRGQGA